MIALNRLDDLEPPCAHGWRACPAAERKALVGRRDRIDRGDHDRRDPS